MRQPDFSQLLKVLQRKRPDRPTLFEFFLNGPLVTRLTGTQAANEYGTLPWFTDMAQAFVAAGYDYITTHASNFCMPAGNHTQAASISQNEGGVIFDRASFGRYPWPDPEDSDYSRLEQLKTALPEGMKIIVYGPGGILENAIGLCGYENLAIMVMDDPRLAGDIFDAIGSRMVRYYQIAGKYSSVGAMISNDDWGFAQQTMLSPADMRKHVFPWHKRIVRAIHEARGGGVPAILHSCGNLRNVWDDLIDDIGFDAKHSYEDKILPVEEAYQKYGSRIAILGGIDVDFVCRSSREQIHQRCCRMLKLTETRGGYALGTGNSVPEYVPQENYLAMIQAANPEARFVA